MKFGFLKRLGTLTGVLCILAADSYGLTIVPPGNVSGVWTAANAPYVIEQGNITVANGSSLIILPGTRVEFTGHHKFVVNGHLRALGTATDSVVFTSTTDSTESQGPSGWKGLRLIGADSTRFEYCVFEKGKATLGTATDSTGGAAFLSGTGTHVIFRNCTFRNNYAGSNGGALHVSGGTSVECTDCRFVNNRTNKDGGAAFVNNSSASRFERCEFGWNRSGKEAGAIHSRFGAPTYLDCNFHHNVCFNSGGAVTASGQPSFRRCFFEYNISENSQGGGLYFYDSTTTASLDSCYIYRNRTLLRDGGGAYCWEAAPRFTDCKFVENESADDGGGIHCYRPGANPIFTRCLFKSNVAADRGGGLKISRESYAALVDCQILDNRSNGRGGGGIFCRFQARPTITNCRIENNSSAGTGGGVCTIESNPHFFDCIIRANATDSLGGGIFAYSSDVDLTRCTVSGNQAGMHGGAISLTDSSPDLIDCKIQGNSADSLGGAIYLSGALPTFTNCLISSNRSEVMGGIGVVTNSRPTFRHCTMAENSSTFGNSFVNSESPGVILNSIIVGVLDSNGQGDDPNGVGFVGGSVPWTIRNSLFHAIGTPSFVGAVPAGLGELTSVNVNGDVCDGYGNLFTPPGFIGTGSNPYDLVSDSSRAVGAGTLEGISSDLLGAQRPMPVSSLPDMGCYEVRQTQIGSGLWGSVTGTLGAGSYRVFGDIIVPQGHELIIEAGAEIEFMGPFAVLVYGKLTVAGSEVDSVRMHADTVANLARWRGIRFFGDEPTSSTIQYLSLSHAMASAIDSSGGAFGFFGNSKPSISNSTIHNCSSPSGGGAIQVRSGEPVFSSCVVSNCNSSSGGGIRVEGNANLIFRHGRIEGCSADIGGAVSVQSGTLTFTEVILSNNVAEDGGAIYSRNSALSLSNVVLAYNSADILGGAIYGSISSLECDNLSVQSNTAATGGGMYLTGCNGNVVNSKVVDNYASESGGAVRLVGGDVGFSRGVFTGNVAGQFGAAFRMSNDSSRVDRCTIVDNHSGSGSAAYLESSRAIISSSQITNNGSGVYFRSSSNSTIRHSNVYRNGTTDFQYFSNQSSNGPAQIGVYVYNNHLEHPSDIYFNINVDPLYTDFDGGNYQLSEYSTCMDAGDPSVECDADLSFIEIGAFTTLYSINPWPPQKLAIIPLDSTGIRLNWAPAKTTRLCDPSGLYFEVEMLDSVGGWQQVYFTQDTTCVLPLDSAWQQVTPLRVRSVVAP